MQTADSTHHAQLFAVTRAHDLFEYVTSPQAERVVVEVDRFLIEHARELRRTLLLQPTSASVVVIIFARSFTVEAQNALLKEFEEPRRGVRYCLGTPQPEQLLGTLRSRLEQQSVERNNDAAADDSRAVYETFKAASLAERMELITAHTKAKDTAWIGAVYEGAVADLAHSQANHHKRTALLADHYWQLPGTSKKMWLEEFALLL